jgi:hypothetical protein
MTEVVENHATAASEATIEAVAAALRDRNIDVVVVDDGEAAGRFVLEQLPEGAEVHSGKSKTLEDAGIYRELRESGRYDFLRTRMMAMDRQTQAREIRKLIAAPDYMLGSVAAVTEAGVLVAASATASQLGPYAAGAGKLILVVGSQKIVSDLDAALRRIQEYVFPWEDARVHETLGVSTILGKVLLIEREWIAHRTTVVLVRQPIGI